MCLNITNALIVNSDNAQERVNLRIANGRIEKITPVDIAAFEPTSEDVYIDAAGYVILPGLIDVHSHLRDPGQEYREDIVSGTRSAAKGGFTSVCCMPNTKPVLDTPELVRYVIEKNSNEGCINVFPIAAITKGLIGLELTDMKALRDAGAVAVSDDGRPVPTSGVMLKAIKAAHENDLRIISHCEECDLSEGGCMNEGMVSETMGVKGIPTAAEDIMVSRELILADYAGLPVHIAHVSTALSVDLIRQAKRRGTQVTAETCPHYFTLTEEACIQYGANAKMSPPLRSQKDVDAVIEGLKDGTLDMIATDHAPHHESEKNNGFEKANNGILGFETAFALSYTYLVKAGHLSLNELSMKMSRNPSDLMNLSRGKIEVGAIADLILVDFNHEFTFDKESMKSKSRNTPYDGWKLYGEVRYTFVDGKIVYQMQ
jgi:dihydroorotase